MIKKICLSVLILANVFFADDICSMRLVNNRNEYFQQKNELKVACEKANITKIVKILNSIPEDQRPIILNEPLDENNRNAMLILLSSNNNEKDILMGTIYLIKNGSNVHRRDANGYQAIHFSSMKKYDSVNHFLQLYGADIDVKTNPRSLMELTVKDAIKENIPGFKKGEKSARDLYKEQDGLVTRLIAPHEIGALNPMLEEEKQNERQMYYRQLEDYLKTKGIIEDEKKLKESLLDYIKNKNYKEFRKFIDEIPKDKFDEIIKSPIDEEKNTPFHLLGMKNDQETQRKLLLILSKMPKLNLSLRNEKGMTPLHVASENKNMDVIQIFLDAGADPNEKFGSGLFGFGGKNSIDLYYGEKSSFFGMSLISPFDNIFSDEKITLSNRISELNTYNQRIDEEEQRRIDEEERIRLINESNRLNELAIRADEARMNIAREQIALKDTLAEINKIKGTEQTFMSKIFWSTVGTVAVGVGGYLFYKNRTSRK